MHSVKIDQFLKAGIVVLSAVLVFVLYSFHSRAHRRRGRFRPGFHHHGRQRPHGVVVLGVSMDTNPKVYRDFLSRTTFPS
jgi:hypothetical protein